MTIRDVMSGDIVVQDRGGRNVYGRVVSTWYTGTHARGDLMLDISWTLHDGYMENEYGVDAGSVRLYESRGAAAAERLLIDRCMAL